MNGSIADLYQVLAVYRLGDDFCGTSFGVSYHDYTALTSKPITELSVEDLESYVERALTTWGNVGHFKHFLPRLLELACQDYLRFCQPEALFAKLGLARWQSWPPIERDAVERSLMTFWFHQLQQSGDFPRDRRIEFVLAGLIKACDSLQPFLDQWVRFNHPNAALHLCQIIEFFEDDSSMPGSRRRLGSPTEAPAQALLCWLRSEQVDHYLRDRSSLIAPVFPALNPPRRMGA